MLTSIMSFTSYGKEKKWCKGNPCLQTRKKRMGWIHKDKKWNLSDKAYSPDFNFIGKKEKMMQGEPLPSTKEEEKGLSKQR